jgi:hypothetical protein
MERGIIRTFLISFAALLLFIFIVFKIFHHSHPKPAPNPSVPVVKPLPDYAGTLAEVSFTQDGRINGDDKHRAIKITVDKFQRKIDIVGGYSGNILEEHTFPNSEDAYNVFLHSLRSEGFTFTRKKPTSGSEVGQCPQGRRFILELNDSGDVLSRHWATTCGTGTSGARIGTIQTLFQAQITDYNKIISSSKVQL